MEINIPIPACELQIFLENNSQIIGPTTVKISNDSNISSISHSLFQILNISESKQKQYLILLNFAGIPIPLQKDNDFWNLMLKLLKMGETPKFTIQKRINRKQVIQFSENGQIINDSLGVLSNRPNHKMHKISDPEVFCVFCKKSSKDEEIIQVVGPMYGPIKTGKFKKEFDDREEYFMHELCAVWTSAVYLDQTTNKLKNLSKEIKRSKLLKCSYCGQYGAGLGCFIESCSKNYHYKCMLDAGCFPVYNEFITYCPDHIPENIENLETEK